MTKDDKEKFEKDLKTLFGPQKTPIYIFDKDNEDQVEEFKERYEYIKSLPEDQRELGDNEFLEAFKEEFDEEFYEVRKAREILEKEFNERKKKESLEAQVKEVRERYEYIKSLPEDQRELGDNEFLEAFKEEFEGSQTNCQNTSICFVKEDNKEQIKENIEIYEAIASLPEDQRKPGDKEFLEDFKALVERWKTTLNSLKEIEEIKNIKPGPIDEMLFDLSTQLPKEQVELQNKEISRTLKNITKESMFVSSIDNNDPTIIDICMEPSDIRRAKGICNYLGMECKVEGALGGTDAPWIIFNYCDSFSKILLAKKLYHSQSNYTDYEEIGKILCEEVNREISLKQSNILLMSDIPDGVELLIGAIICGLLGLDYLKRDNENLEYAPWSGIEIIREEDEDFLEKVKFVYARIRDSSLTDVVADPEAFEHILANAKIDSGCLPEDSDDENSDDPHKWDGLNTYMNRVLSSDIYLYAHLRKMIVKEVRANQQSLDEYGDSYMFDERAFIKKYFEITDGDKLDRSANEEELTKKVIEFILAKLEKIKRGDNEKG